MHTHSFLRREFYVSAKDLYIISTQCRIRKSIAGKIENEVQETIKFSEVIMKVDQKVYSFHGINNKKHIIEYAQQKKTYTPIYPNYINITLNLDHISR